MHDSSYIVRNQLCNYRTYDITTVTMPCMSILLTLMLAISSISSQWLILPLQVSTITLVGEGLIYLGTYQWLFVRNCRYCRHQVLWSSDQHTIKHHSWLLSFEMSLWYLAKHLTSPINSEQAWTNEISKRIECMRINCRLTGVAVTAFHI